MTREGARVQHGDTPSPKRSERDSGVHESPENQPLGGLVKKLSRDTSILFRNEIELAKADARISIEQTKREVVMTTLAGATLYAGVLALVAGTVMFLAFFVAAWLAALVVGGALSLIGLSMLGRAKKLVNEQENPTKNMSANVRADISAMKEGIR